MAPYATHQYVWPHSKISLLLHLYTLNVIHQQIAVKRGILFLFVILQYKIFICTECEVKEFDNGVTMGFTVFMPIMCLKVCFADLN